MRRIPGHRAGLPVLALGLALGLALAGTAVLGTAGGAHAKAPDRAGHATKHATEHGTTQQGTRHGVHQRADRKADRQAQRKAQRKAGHKKRRTNGKAHRGKHATGAPALPSVVLTPGTTYFASTRSETQQIAIPLADGLTPRQVRGTLAVDNEAAGTVQILAHGQLVTTVHTDAATASVPVTIPVGAQDVSAGRLLLSLRYRADPPSDPGLSCLRSDDGTVELRDLAIDATGTAQAPTTLATFFGQAVTAVSIVVPTADTASLQEAGLAAEAALVHRYPTADVTLTTPADAGRAAPLTPAQGRIVRLVTGSGDVRTSIEQASGVPTLTLTGDPAKLADAAAALGSDDLALAATPAATRLGQTGVVGGTAAETFADLGQSAPSLRGMGRSSFALTVRQSDFGASVKQMKVHVVGRYTQLPASVQAMLTYTWNDQVLGSQVLRNDDTAIDSTFSVPATQLAFSNTLEVQLSAVPSGAGGSGSATCGPLGYLPIQASFDAKASTVSAVRGQSAEPGFARFPQTLGNVLTTAFGDGATADDLTNAAAVLRALQRLNTDQLRVDVVAAAQLVDSSASGLLVGATGAQLDALRPPLLMDEFRSIDRQNVRFGVGVTDPFAALEGFQQHGRDLLMLASWTPGAEDAETGRRLQSALVDDLARTSGAWYALTGDVLVRQQVDGTNVSLASNSVVPQPEKVHHLATYAWWILAFVGLLCLLLLAQWLSTRRLRERARRLVDAQEGADATERDRAGAAERGGDHPGDDPENDPDDDAGEGAGEGAGERTDAAERDGTGDGSAR